LFAASPWFSQMADDGTSGGEKRSRRWLHHLRVDASRSHVCDDD
jgi:hypothetical protein